MTAHILRKYFQILQWLVEDVVEEDLQLPVEMQLKGESQSGLLPELELMKGVADISATPRRKTGGVMDKFL